MGSTYINVECEDLPLTFRIQDDLSGLMNLTDLLDDTNEVYNQLVW